MNQPADRIAVAELLEADGALVVIEEGVERAHVLVVHRAGARVLRQLL